MKKIIKVLAIFFMAMVVTSNFGYADFRKGQRVYLKKLKQKCGFTGAKFAYKHTQEEWLEINEAGLFEVKIKEICPKSKKLKEKYIPHLFDFVYEYAKDSGNVPSC